MTDGRPLAAELVAAVAEFLETDVRQATSGQVNFHARVAANALRIVERELLDESEEDCANALAGLGVADEDQLAAAIRAGQLDGRDGAVTAAPAEALIPHGPDNQALDIPDVHSAAAPFLHHQHLLHHLFLLLLK